MVGRGCRGIRFLVQVIEPADEEEDPEEDEASVALPVWLNPGLVGMVVAVVDVGIGNGMTVARVELLEQGLRYLFLMIAELPQEVVGLITSQGAEVVTLEIHMLEIAELLQLVLADGRLVRSAIRDVELPLLHMRLEPFLRGQRNAGMLTGDPRMSAVDIRIGETGPRDPDRGAAPGRPKGVVCSPTPDAQGGAPLPEVPTNTGEEFDGSPETKKTHGFMSEGASQKARGNEA